MSRYSYVYCTLQTRDSPEEIGLDQPFQSYKGEQSLVKVQFVPSEFLYLFIVCGACMSEDIEL
jgi:hypothetical protein